MNYLGQTVTDSITGLSGICIAQSQTLHDGERVLITSGSAFETVWLSASRVRLADGAGKVATAVKPAAGAPTPAAATPATNGATPPAAPSAVATAAALTAAAAPAVNTAAYTAAPAAVNPVTLAVETYAKVAAAFIVLGKAGQGATIQKILATHNAAHAKQISDNAVALADVLAQAQAAIAALPATAAA